MEKGAEIFRRDTTTHEQEKRIAKMERLIRYTEVKIALLTNSLNRNLILLESIGNVRGGPLQTESHRGPF